MAGEGRRFKEAGYTVPKPFIPIHGRPMIHHIIENLRPVCNDWIFLIREEHMSPGVIKSLKNEVHSCDIITVPALTQGAACTVLLAKNHIFYDEPVLIANADQLIHYDMKNWLSHRDHSMASVWVFGPETNPKWSYAKVEGDFITEVAEKNPISPWATCGVYYWKNWGDYVDCADKMINRNIRVNNEFYVCPVYNIFLEKGLHVWPFFVDKMIGLGDPESVEAYLNSTPR